MTQLKKILAALVAVSLLASLALTGCGNKSQTEADPSVEVSTSAPETTPADEEQDEEEEPVNVATPAPSVSQEPSAAPSVSTSVSAKPSTSAKPSASPKPSQPAPTPTPTPTPEPSPEPSNPAAPVGATPSDIMAKIDSQYEFPAMMEMDGDTISAVYGLDLSLAQDYCVKMPLMNVKVNEIAIIRVKDAKDVETVKSVLSARKASVVQQFEQYLQDQLEIAKAAIIGSTGNYVYLVMDPNASAIVDLIKANAK